MRISDWSSDVCSSDLLHAPRHGLFDRRQPRVSQCRGISRRGDHLRVSGRLGRVALREEPDDQVFYGLDVPLPFVPGETHSPLSKGRRSEEHTSELQSLMRISYAVFCLKKKKKQN